MSVAAPHIRLAELELCRRFMTPEQYQAAQASIISEITGVPPTPPPTTPIAAPTPPPTTPIAAPTPTFTPTPPTTPTSQAIVVHTPSAPRKGRRKRPQSRGPRQSPYNKPELNRRGFGIPRDNSDNIKDFILNEFVPDTGVTSKRELMEWCYREVGLVCPENATRNSHVGKFYKLISEQCPNHYYSYESEDSANANIRVYLKDLIYS